MLSHLKTSVDYPTNEWCVLNMESILWLHQPHTTPYTLHTYTLHQPQGCTFNWLFVVREQVWGDKGRTHHDKGRTHHQALHVVNSGQGEEFQIVGRLSAIY